MSYLRLVNYLKKIPETILLVDEVLATNGSASKLNGALNNVSNLFSLIIVWFRSFIIFIGVCGALLSI